MKYSIIVKSHSVSDHRKGEESALTVVPCETIERMIRRAGISPHSEVVEIRLLWEGRAVEPFPAPAEPLPMPEVVPPKRRQSRR